VVKEVVVVAAGGQTKKSLKNNLQTTIKEPLLGTEMKTSLQTLIVTINF